MTKGYGRDRAIMLASFHSMKDTTLMENILDQKMRYIMDFKNIISYLKSRFLKRSEWSSDQAIKKIQETNIDFKDWIKQKGWTRVWSSAKYP